MPATSTPHGLPQPDEPSQASKQLNGHFGTLWLLFIALLAASAAPAAAQDVLIPMDSSWRFTRGTNEASNPATAWRTLAFDDSGSRWTTAPAPFHFGENLSNGTLLSDMRYNYTCVYLRKTFVVTNLAELDSLILDVHYDDGFVAWVNGTELARHLVNDTAYTATATGPHEAGTLASFTKTSPTFVENGTNVLTIQAFNVNKSSSTDFRIHASLRATYREQTRPTISAITPSAGSTVPGLNSVFVTFSEPVYGIDASDLLINELPAAGVVGDPGTNRYLFTFTQPFPGQVQIGWDIAHGITDLSDNTFDSEASSASWFYELVDSSAPKIVDLAPVAGAQVRELTQVQVLFDEPVTGVSADDLLINQTPALSVSGEETGPYIFTFAQPAAGPVAFAWKGNHGIRDLSPAGNAFAGSGWSLTLNPAVSQGDIIINEFLPEATVTRNSADLDEDGELQDWIELYNRGASAVNLLGWSLTDDRDQPHKWVFPSVVLNPGQYLLVYASEKDRRVVGANTRLHTNFKLNPFGEYLALASPEYPPQFGTVFTNGYPEQRPNYSYGLNSENAWRYYGLPTPGAANGQSGLTNVAPQPHFTVTRGFFNSPFNLLLTIPLANATIYYTLDGSEPGPGNGTVYSGPININKTTCVRASTVANGHLPSRTETHTYLYLDQVLEQSATPPGVPSLWGLHSGFSAYGGVVPADYEMDWDPLRVDPNDPFSPVDPEKLERFQQGMRDLPSVSVVMNVEDMFGTNSLHWRSTQKIPVIEKPCSIEMILPDGKTAFAVTAGIRMHGNASREPIKNPKHGFKLKFKGDFGESTLKYRLFPDSAAEEHDDILLRSDFNSSWRHWSDTATQGAGAYQRSRGTRTRYPWGMETMRAMGHVAPHNRFCHLFINGLYWGTYDFSEQPTGRFAQTHSPAPGGHDIYEQGALREGSSVVYNAMQALSNLENRASYEQMKQYLDVPQHIDYMLMHFFIGHQDWGNIKNWYAMRPRAEGPLGRFRYVPWDQECILLNENVNRVSSTDVPSGLHTKLDDNPEYRLEFADRAHKHLVAPDGALTPEANIARWQKWQKHLDRAIVAESVRWGDYRRDVHPYLEGTYELYTREQHWLAEHDRMVGSYFVNRNGILLSQLRSAGLYPSLNAPEYREGTANGTVVGSRAVQAGSVLAMTSTGGSVYYTTNGTDPRVAYTGTVAPDARLYTSPLVLNAAVTLKARAFDGANWSALNEATFTVSQLVPTLRFSEIMFNPPGGDAYEFVEVHNHGTLAFDLSGFSFQGLTYSFPPGAVLSPGAVYLLASSLNTNAFATRYPGVVVNGYFEGSLANGGERLTIVDRLGQPVVSVFYDDEAGWPAAADGGGSSLENVAPHGDPGAAANWIASPVRYGTPGLPPNTAPTASGIVINELMALNASSVTNAGTLPDWIELRNLTSTNIDISQWSLTDDSNPRRFVFPPGTVITNGGYLVVWCDSAVAAPGLHTGFALGADGETVALFDAATNRVEAVTYGVQLADYTVGKINGDWKLTVPTPGTANAAAITASVFGLRINEWLTASGPGASDWLEIYNPQNAPVELLGIHLSTSNAVQQLRSLSFVAAESYFQVFADEDPGAAHLDLSLPAEGGLLKLLSATGVEIDSVIYAAQQPATSEGRLPDGSFNIQPFPGTATPGAANYIQTYSGPVLNEVMARNDRAVLSPWGTYSDWVEIQNNSGASVGLGGMGLSDSANGAKPWFFPAGISLGAGARLLVWCDAAKPATTSASADLNSGFNLSGSSGSLVLLSTNQQIVDSVSYGFQVPDRSLGKVAGVWKLLGTPSPGQPNGAAATLGSVSNLRLNEWMANPTSGDDWIEVYNADPLPVDLGGLYLTDDPSVTGIVLSQVPPLSFVGGNAWVLWIADGNSGQGADHVGFSLNASGESLRLYSTDLSLLDVQDFGIQASGTSSGRLPDGAQNLAEFPSTASPDESNYLLLTNVLVNEVLAHSDPPLEDAIELYNKSSQSVNVGGWFVSDRQSNLKQYRIPDGTVIPGNDFLALYQAQFGPADGEQDIPPRFSLSSAHGDAVYLSEADGAGNLTGFRSFARFGASANGVSIGRHVTSVGEDFVPLSARTFGVDAPASVEQFRLGKGLANAAPLVGPVVITEIMYRPQETTSDTGVEYIELYNAGSTAVTLYDPLHATNRWRLVNAVEFEFPAQTSLAPGECIVVVPFDPASNPAEKAAFEARYGTGIRMAGPFSGKLDNSGETVELLRPDAPQSPPRPDAGFVPYILVERVSYMSTNPWPSTPNGLGDSLHRADASDYSNDPVHWIADQPNPGRFGTVITDQDQDGLPDWWEDLFGTQKALADADLDPDGDGMNNMQEYLAGTLPQSAESNLKLTVSAGVGTALLEFNAASNRTYSVLFKSDLANETWLKLQDIESRSTNWNGSIVDSPGAGARFYRLVTPKLP